jgi:hypothetical protein
LLLHGDGTNNANNHAFVDSSNNNFAITRNGNATQGTFSPFSPTGWSGYFDGTGDYLTVSNNAVLNPGSNNFTIEAWINPTNLSSVQCIHYKSESDGTGVLFAINNSGAGKVNFYIGTGGAWGLILDSPAVIVANIWTHVAVTKNGTTHTIWVNGVSVASTTYAGNPVNTNEDLKIGRFRSANPFEFNGYISNYRFVNGTALYTSAFTPSTSAITAVANTTLLTLQSNRFIDNSTNGFTITRNGDVSIQAFSPFAPSVEYTANTHGGSAYFDGTGDYLQAGTSANLALGSGDFTIDGWLYSTGYNGGAAIYSSINTYPSSTGILFYIHSGGQYYVDVNGQIIVSSAAATLNTWNHFALVRNSTTLTLYINGVSVGSVSSSTNFTDQYAVIGRTGAGAASNYFLGYLSNIRMIKGTALYTTTFTPPTAPTTAVANTQLLCNFTNAGILDSTGKNVLETVGDAKVNTAIKKYGTGSMYFDGTGDQLTAYSTAQNLNALSSGDFTIEGWINTSTLTPAASYACIVGMQDYSGTKGWGVWQLNQTILVFFNATVTTVTTGNVITATGTWYHIAVTRSNGSVRVFINGTLAAGPTSVSFSDSTTTPLTVGGISTATGWNANYPFYGYIDDLRITKGIARYVQNFTPPTAAFLNK